IQGLALFLQPVPSIIFIINYLPVGFGFLHTISVPVIDKGNDRVVSGFTWVGWRSLIRQYRFNQPVEFIIVIPGGVRVGLRSRSISSGVGLTDLVSDFIIPI